MKYLKKLAIAALAAMALTALVAGSASATTLEVGGTTKNEKIEVTATPKSGTSGVMKRTDGTLANTCTGGSATGVSTTPFTGSTVSGTFLGNSGGTCERPVTVHKQGTATIEWISGTNGTVTASGGEATVGSPFGTLTCKTSGTHAGVLTGKSSGEAEMHGNAVVNCGFLLPSAVMSGTGVVTSPGGLGVVS